MAQVKSTIKLNIARVKQLDRAGIRALENTAKALHTEVVQAQVIPRMDGALQGEKMFVDTARSAAGKVAIVHEGPYARRLYYHPEYNFQKEPWEEDVKNKDGTISHLTHEGNPNAKGKWFEDWLPGGSQEEFVGKAFKKFYREEADV